MNNDMLSLDFFNSHFFIRVDGKEYYWQNLNKFVEQTGFPFAETSDYISYEPNRDIYHVQRKDNKEIYPGIEQPEIQWFISNKPNLVTVISNLIELDKPVITVEMQRAQYLYDTDWLVQRHQEELLRQVPTTLSPEQFAALLTYKQELRNITQQYPRDEPAEIVSWPTKPFNF